MEKWELFLAFVMPEWYLAPLTMSVFQQTTPSATNQPTKNNKGNTEKETRECTKIQCKRMVAVGGEATTKRTMNVIVVTTTSSNAATTILMSPTVVLLVVL